MLHYLDLEESGVQPNCDSALHPRPDQKAIGRKGTRHLRQIRVCVCLSVHVCVCLCRLQTVWSALDLHVYVHCAVRVKKRERICFQLVQL